MADQIGTIIAIFLARIAEVEAERDELQKALEHTAYLLKLMRDRPTDRHKLTYTNWRGETSVRELHLCGLYMGSTEWHPKRQMLLKAFDWEKDAYRDFAVKDFDFSEAIAPRGALATTEGSPDAD